MKSFLGSFFSNWSRKIAGVATVVITIIASFVAYGMLRKFIPPTLGEWTMFLKELAITYGILIAIAGGKSVLTDVVAGLRAKGAKAPEPIG